MPAAARATSSPLVTARRRTASSNWRSRCSARAGRQGRGGGGDAGGRGGAGGGWGDPPRDLARARRPAGGLADPAEADRLGRRRERARRQAGRGIVDVVPGRGEVVRGVRMEQRGQVL